MGGREKGRHLRRLIGLIALAGAAAFTPVAIGATSAAASTAVPAPSCLADGGSKVSCTESSSPVSVTVTWYIYDEASTPSELHHDRQPGIDLGVRGVVERVLQLRLRRSNLRQRYRPVHMREGIPLIQSAPVPIGLT
jgi:hypothetical protein